MSVSKMIKGHELFRSFSFEEVEQISTFSGTKTLETGEHVFCEGGEGSHFFVMLDGKVNLVLPAEDRDSSMVVGRMVKGDIFGVSPLLGLGRYTTNARCAVGSTVLAVEAAAFRTLLENNPVVGQNAMKVMARAYFSRYIDTLKRFQNVLNDLAIA